MEGVASKVASLKHVSSWSHSIYLCYDIAYNSQCFQFGQRGTIQKLNGMAKLATSLTECSQKK